jgi:hypothetical protein
MTIWLMRSAFLITKAANIQSEYVILIAFTSTMVVRTPSSVMLYMHCVFCCFSLVVSLKRKMI